MKFTAVVFHLIACVNVSLAFSPLLQRSSTLVTHHRAPTHIFSSQWDEDDDDEEVATSTEDAARTSFQDASIGIKDEDDKKKMDDMGDYDSNPAVRLTK
jgi:hypothetical protein